MSAEVRVVAEDIIARYILPLPTPPAKDKEIDEDEWAARLMRIISNLDQPTFESLLSMTGLQSV
jgi:sister-chromatid-cohesion protein PDS5